MLKITSRLLSQKQSHFPLTLLTSNTITSTNEKTQSITASLQSIKQVAHYLFRKNTLEQMCKYNDLVTYNWLINGRCRVVALFKDFWIKDDHSEFLKREYTYKEARTRLNKLFKYYDSTSMIYPNYIPLPEAQFIYKNIMHKQKWIDDWQDHEEKIKNKNRNRNDKYNNAKTKKKKGDTYTNNWSDRVFNSIAYDNIMNQTEDNSMMVKAFGWDVNTWCNKRRNCDKDEDDSNESGYMEIDNIINTITKGENTINNIWNFIGDGRNVLNVTTNKNLKIIAVDTATSNQMKIAAQDLIDKTQNKHKLALSLQSLSPATLSRMTQIQRSEHVVNSPNKIVNSPCNIPGADNTQNSHHSLIIQTLPATNSRNKSIKAKWAVSNTCMNNPWNGIKKLNIVNRNLNLNRKVTLKASTTISASTTKKRMNKYNFVSNDFNSIIATRRKPVINGHLKTQSVFQLDNNTEKPNPGITQTSTFRNKTKRFININTWNDFNKKWIYEFNDKAPPATERQGISSLSKPKKKLFQLDKVEYKYTTRNNNNTNNSNNINIFERKTKNQIWKDQAYLNTEGFHTDRNKNKSKQIKNMNYNYNAHLK